MAARLPDNMTRKQMLQNALCSETPLKEAMKRMLRVNDEQIAVNRYKWHNLPPELNGNLIERILYYRGQGMLFYVPEMTKFYFLPYTLEGSIDIYGRYDNVKPLPFMGKDEIEGKGKAASVLFSSQTREPVYDYFTNDDPMTFLETKCVLLNDYSKQLSQTVIPRQKINEDIIDIESNIIPYVNTLLSNSTGVAGMRVNDGDEQASVENASQTANTAALNGKRWIAIKSQLDLQDFSTVAGGRAEDMLLAMQSIDNIRLGTFGVENGGIFEKKAHMLNAEAAMNTGTSGLIMDDGLVQRQKMCDIINHNVLIPMGFPLDALWDCTINETAAGYDRDMDGMIGGEGNTDNTPSAEQQEVTDDE